MRRGNFCTGVIVCSPAGPLFLQVKLDGRVVPMVLASMARRILSALREFFDNGSSATGMRQRARRLREDRNEDELGSNWGLTLCI